MKAVEARMKEIGYGKKAIRNALRKELRKIGREVEISVEQECIEYE